MTRIVVVGGINMDLHLFGGRRRSSGSTLIVDHYLTQPGGKGGNVARTAARLGAEVLLVARVGDDEFGRQAVDAVHADAVDVSAVAFSAGGTTGFAAIELDEGLHRTLLFAPGANDDLTWDDVAPTLDSLDAGDIVITQAEVPPDVLRRLADHVARLDVHLFLDPTPPERVDADVLRSAEVITPNRVEAAALVGRVESSELWPSLAADDLRRAGARTVVVKAGESGAVIADHDGVRRIPTLPVDAVDETGAGDVFLAALAVRRAEHASWDAAVRWANVASALSVADQGLHLPERATVDDADRRVAGGSA